VEKGTIVRGFKRIERLRVIKEGNRINCQLNEWFVSKRQKNEEKYFERNENVRKKMAI
jgi:hypothetical protein